MAVKPRGKKWLKITGIVLGCLVVLLVGFHIWFRAHARHLLEDLVARRSNGKVNMKLKKLHFGYFSNKLELENVEFYNTDLPESNTLYNFSVKRLHLKVKALWPVLFRNEFLIDSLFLSEPDIRVTRVRPGKTDSTNKKEVSIPAEMGKVYNSIRDALKVLKVSSFQINEGTFTLTNSIRPEETSLTITHINMHIDNFHVDTAIKDPAEKILFSDNIVLGSHHQDIIFPDGRHRLSFRNFHINLKEKIVRFDSCTIAATRTDSANASFHVYLDTLLLTNIDFDTLYRSDLIRADSVYCVNPKFTLEVETGRNKGAGIAPPRLEDLVKQLTGDLELAHVVVSNAEFNIRTVRDSIPTSFVFTQNNFEMEGLHIKQDAPSPIQVEKFVMAIRNYENFIKDSTYSILFDSIILNDDRITLSNFVFNKLRNGKITNSFRIPQFNLQGLSWDDLVFERRLKAEQAIMFNPVINYSIIDPKRKENIFQVLGAVNEFMDLQYLDVIDGKIDLRINDALRIQLDSATLAVQSHSLLTSKKLASIKNSLTRLYFKRGRIHAGNLGIYLEDIRYIGNTGQLDAGKMEITDDEKNLDIQLNNTAVNRMKVDEMANTIYAEGLSWQSGSVKISTTGKTTDKPVTIELHNVRGRNTTLEGQFGDEHIMTSIDNIFLAGLMKKPGQQIEIPGISLTGSALSIVGLERKVRVKEYELKDNEPSRFTEVDYDLSTPAMSAMAKSPLVTLIPRMEALLKGQIRFDDAVIHRPEMNLRRYRMQPSRLTPRYPLLDVNKVRLTQPVINYTQERDGGIFSLQWNGGTDPASFLAFEGLHADNGDHAVLSAKKAEFHLSGFETTGTRGRKFITGEGSISGRMSNVDFIKENDLPAEWRASIQRLEARQLEFDSLGKKNGRLSLSSATMRDFNISTTRVINLRKLVGDNKLFSLSDFTGKYSDASTNLAWLNARFSRATNLFILDSASIMPADDQATFMSRQTYQSDYVTATTGSISIGPVDAELYAAEEKLKAGKVVINNAVITDSRDKNLPRKETGSRLLPGAMVKKIPFPVSIDTVQLHDSRITYTEINPELGTTTVVPIHHLNGTIRQVRNFDYQINDSLHIQASTRLLDTVDISLQVKESYADALQGFHMKASIQPVDLRALNPVLEPATLVKIRSGKLDSLSLRVTGREEVAFGEINFHYHDLKIQLLKKASGQKKRAGFLNFLVNSFVVKNKNRKMGTAFYVRERQRSAFNYLVKILMSGIMNSVGAMNHKKDMKPYEKEISNATLPVE